MRLKCYYSLQCHIASILHIGAKLYKELTSSGLPTEIKEKLNGGTHEPPDLQPADGKKTNGDNENEDEEDLPFIGAPDVSWLINAIMVILFWLMIMLYAI